MVNKKNIPLLIGVLIPIAMIILVAAAIYLPALFSQPKYDFIYLTGDYYYPQYYVDNDGKLVRKDVVPPEPNYPPNTESRLFYHDIKTNESRQISYDEAKDYNLDINIKSPDGYEIVNGNGAEFFPFFGGSGNDSHYIKGHNASKKLNLQSQGGYYNFRFLGWVK